MMLSPHKREQGFDFNKNSFDSLDIFNIRRGPRDACVTSTRLRGPPRLVFIHFEQQAFVQEVFV